MRELNESQKRDIRMYGVTEAEMREAVVAEACISS